MLRSTSSSVNALGKCIEPHTHRRPDTALPPTGSGRAVAMCDQKARHVLVDRQLGRAAGVDPRQARRRHERRLLGWKSPWLIAMRHWPIPSICGAADARVQLGQERSVSSPAQFVANRAVCVPCRGRSACNHPIEAHASGLLFRTFACIGAKPPGGRPEIQPLGPFARRGSVARMQFHQRRAIDLDPPTTSPSSGETCKAGCDSPGNRALGHIGPDDTLQLGPVPLCIGLRMLDARTGKMRRAQLRPPIWPRQDRPRCPGTSRITSSSRGPRQPHGSVAAQPSRRPFGTRSIIASMSGRGEGPHLHLPWRVTIPHGL